jgi:hypothetical protein
MPIFSEYHIQDTLHESLKTVIYQGEKLNQNNSIIFQPIEAKYQTVKTLARLKHEYLIHPNFNHESLGYLTAGFAREIRHPLKYLNSAQSSVELREKLLE